MTNQELICNAATWMLEISTVSAEERLGRDFADLFDQSNLARFASHLKRKLNSQVEAQSEYHIITSYPFIVPSMPDCP